MRPAAALTIAWLLSLRCLLVASNPTRPTTKTTETTTTTTATDDDKYGDDKYGDDKYGDDDATRPPRPIHEHEIQGRSLHSDEVHEDILRNHEPEHIIESSQLDDFERRHGGTDAMAYLADRRSWVPMSPGAATDRRRFIKEMNQMGCQSNRKYSMPNGKKSNSPWEPASACLWTEENTNGGYLDMGWQRTFQATVNGRGDVGTYALNGTYALEGSGNVQITNSWQKSGTMRCAVAGGTVGQMMIMKGLMNGDLKITVCFTKCWLVDDHCSIENVIKGLVAPTVDDAEGIGYQLACVQGRDKVRCDDTLDPPGFSSPTT